MNTIPTIAEQKERGLKFLAKVQPTTEPTDTEAICAYKANIRVGIYLTYIAPINLVKSAIKRLKNNADAILGKQAIRYTLECSQIRHFETISERDAYMLCLEDTNTSYELMEPEVADFLEQYLSSSTEKS